MSNGNLTTIALYDGHFLQSQAATSWLRLCNHFGREIAITDSYRSLARQREIFLVRYKPTPYGLGKFNDVRYYAGVRYVRMWGAAAAIPGTSNHGLGLALDLADGVNTGKGQVWDWLQNYAHLFGWFNPRWAKFKPTLEPWHWEYDPSKDTKKNEPLEGVVTNKKEWDEMASREELKQVFMEVLGSTDIAGAVWNRDLGGQGKMEDTSWYILKDTQNTTRALTTAFNGIKTELSKAGVSDELIEKAIGKALAGLEINLKVSD